MTDRLALVGGLLLVTGCRGGGGVTPVPTTVAPALATLAPAPATMAPPDGAPRSVAFTEPADGAQLGSPVTVCLAWTGVSIEAGNEVRPGYGHLLVMVDPTSQEIRRASAMGAPLVPPGPTYIHYADGESCRDLELSAGHHVLFGLLVDGSGTPLNPQTTSRLRLEVIP